MSQTWYGGLAGPSSGQQSRFRAVFQMRTSSQGETTAVIQWRAYVEVTSGNFNGTVVKVSWSTSSYSLYGAGTYADSGWNTWGTVSYGSSTAIGSSAYYTGYSGTTYRSNVTATYSPDVPTWTPNAPTGVGVTRNSDSKATVKWTNNSTTARKYASLTVQRSADGGSWADLATLSASTASYADSTTSANHYYRYRVVAVNSAGSAASSASSYIYNSPSAPSGVTNTRNGDTKNTVTWTRNAPAALLTSQKISRSVDGGSWADLATLSTSAASYADSTTSANHYYKYRVSAANATATSNSPASNSTYNTPAAPASVEAARSGETDVVVTISNPAKTATALELQRRASGSSTWETVSTTSGTVTSVSDSPGGGTFWYRARNTRGSLCSAWRQASSAVVTICAPSAPTLASPANSSVVSVADEQVTFKWTHNPIDGSAQTCAQVQHSTDGGSTWDTVDVSGSAQELTIDNGFGVNSTVTWRARTKGAHEDYSPWSGTRTFRVYQVPTAVVDSPVDAIENTPVEFSFEYSDVSGSLQSSTLSITGGTNGYELDLGTSTSATIERSEWLPVDGETYSFLLTCRSTSTLQCTVEWEVPCAFALPKPAYLGVDYDRDTGAATLKAYVIDGEDGEEVSAVSVFRTHDGDRVCLAEDALGVLSLEDLYAPINVPYVYEAVSYADSGAANARQYTGELRSPYAYFYFGGDLAKAKLNPEESVSVSHANESLVHYAGRRYPVAYDGGSLDESWSFSADVMTREEAMAFRRLMDAGGICVFKSLSGDVMHAKCSVSISEYATGRKFGNVSVDVNRIDGGAL